MSPTIHPAGTYVVTVTGTHNGRPQAFTVEVCTKESMTEDRIGGLCLAMLAKHTELRLGGAATTVTAA